MGRRLTEQEKFLRLCAKGSVKKIKEALSLGADVNEPALMMDAKFTPLSAAAMYENKKAMKFLIENGAEYVSLLFSSVIHDQRMLAEIMVDCGADINARDGAEHTALLCAVNENKINPVKWLIELGADVNIKSATGFNALTYAAILYTSKEFDVDPEIIKILLKKDSDYSDAILLAVREKNIGLLKLMIENGAELNKKNSFGQSPLYMALFDLKDDSDYEIIKFLLNKGADVNEIYTFDDGAVTTPLNVSISMNRPDVAELLLSYGANPDFRDTKGRGALLYSVLTGLEMLKTVLVFGADPDLSDNEGRTALMLAAIDGEVEEGMIETLIDFGADPNKHDKKGVTALMWAIAGKDRSSDVVVSGLIRTGAFMAEGWWKWLALVFLYAFARRESQLNIINFLISHGADVNARDSKGMNAFSYAMINYDYEVADILIAAGSEMN